MSGAGDSAQASGREPVLVPGNGRARINTAARSHEEEIDEAAFAALSRSLPTVTPVLIIEPEMEPAMLRPASRQRQQYAGDMETGLQGDIAGQDGDGEYEDETAVNTQIPTEESPLLARKPSESSFASSHQEQDASPRKSTSTGAYYLNDTSPTRFWLIFSQVLLSLFIACFDSTLMASSHPVITSYFGAANAASWLSTSFLLTSTAFQPLLGRMSDGLGRKPLFVASLAVLAAGTAWCALAGDIGSFIAARAVCGLGAGGATALGSIITSDLVPIE